ncbi:hypothetical protein F4804DRAFT_315490 [Jackrogersella minutella]|nr:hypothetical protein F4804DRAFT_315490 [Jackrogersella minutella]
MLAEKGAALDGSSDIEHGYLIKILKKVEGILMPQKKHRAPNSSSDYLNPFDALKIYDPPEKHANAPDFERPKTVESHTIRYKAEPLTSLEALFVALAMLINDVKKIRSRIEWIWINFQAQHFDLAVAAVATNTAISLTRDLMDNAAPMFEDHGGLWKVLEKFYRAQAMTQGHRPFVNFAKNQKHPGYDAYDIANENYISTYKLVEWLLYMGISSRKQGSSSYDPRSNRASKSGYEKFGDDRALLVNIFTELMIVTHRVDDYPIEDEFLRGINEATSTGKIPFYLIFAAQVFLDIHYILRESVEQGHEKLWENLKSFERGLQEYFKFHKDYKIASWPAGNDEVLRWLQRKVQYILSDPMKKYERLPGRNPGSVEPNRVLKMSPVLSGVMLYHFQSEMWDVGIALANAWGSITYSLHLYNALQKEKLVSKTWRDMDLVRKLLGNENFFVDDPPKNFADYFEKFCLQVGIPAVTFISWHQGKAELPSQLEPRGIRNNSLVSAMFMESYQWGYGRVDWTIENTGKVIGSQELQTDRERLTRKGKIKETANHSTDTETAKFHPDQLLVAVMYRLQKETTVLALPYLAMHLECCSFLQAVRNRCDPLLRKLYPEAHVKDNELPFMLGWMFFEHADRRTTKLLAEAGGAADEFVQRRGDTVLNLLHRL